MTCTLRTAGGYTEILSGLNEGDVVVISESTGSGSDNNNNKNDKNNKDDNADDMQDGNDDRKPWDSNKKPDDMQFPGDQNN